MDLITQTTSGFFHCPNVFCWKRTQGSIRSSSMCSSSSSSSWPKWGQPSSFYTPEVDLPKRKVHLLNHLFNRGYVKLRGNSYYTFFLFLVNCKLKVVTCFIWKWAPWKRETAEAPPRNYHFYCWEYTFLGWNPFQIIGIFWLGVHPTRSWKNGTPCNVLVNLTWICLAEMLGKSSKTYYPASQKGNPAYFHGLSLLVLRQGISANGGQSSKKQSLKSGLT